MLIHRTTHNVCHHTRTIRHNIQPNLAKRSYTTALTRKVSTSITNALSLSPPSSPIDFHKAQSQHDAYVNVLKDSVGLKTIEIPADEAHPDCVFIEDTAVIISGVAVINKIGAESREGEVDAVKDAILNLGLVVHDMREDGYGATLDGGDVLYPVRYREVKTSTSSVLPTEKVGGENLFIGISSRTNMKGFEYLKEKFPNVTVIPVDITNLGSLHLKSIVTHIDEKSLLVPKGSLGNEIIRAMNVKERGYNIIELKDLATCNVVTINGNVLAQPTKCEETKEVLESAVKDRGLNLIWVDASEFAKVDGALTCKSILL